MIRDDHHTNTPTQAARFEQIYGDAWTDLPTRAELDERPEPILATPPATEGERVDLLARLQASVDRARADRDAREAR